jgi:hypothetical protein
MSRASRVVTTRCTIDLERTPQRFHAHVELDGVDVEPGDVVFVHDAPGGVADGERVVVERRATVRRAGWIARTLERLRGRLAFAELIETGFSPGPAPRASPRSGP